MKDKEEKTVCNRSLMVEWTTVENSLTYFKAGLDHVYFIFVRDLKVHTNSLFWNEIRRSDYLKHLTVSIRTVRHS